MGASIFAIILGIIDKILGIFRTKAEVKKEEFKIKNTEEEIRKAIIVRDVAVKDEAEALIKNVKNSKDEARKKYLREVQKRVGG